MAEKALATDEARITLGLDLDGRALMCVSARTDSQAGSTTDARIDPEAVLAARLRPAAQVYLTPVS